MGRIYVWGGPEEGPPPTIESRPTRKNFLTNPLPAAKSREPIERFLVNKPLKGVFGR